MKYIISLVLFFSFGYTSIAHASATPHVAYEPNSILRPPARIEDQQYPISVMAAPVEVEVSAAPVEEVVAAPQIDMRSTVASHVLAVRTGPGFEYSETNAFYARDKVTVLEVSGDWARVAAENGTEGWVIASKLLSYDWRNRSSLPERDTPLGENDCPNECVLSQSTLFDPIPQHVIGNAVMYAPNVMQYTAKSSGFDLAGFVGGVAMSSRAALGEVVWLRNNGGEWEGPYLVVDVSGRYDVWRHVVDQGQVVEVDFETAVRWGMASGKAGNWQLIDGGLDNIEVWTGLTPPDQSVTPDNAIVYKDYFLSHARIGAEEGDNNMWTLAYAQFTSYSEYLLALDK